MANVDSSKNSSGGSSSHSSGSGSSGSGSSGPGFRLPAWAKLAILAGIVALASIGYFTSALWGGNDTVPATPVEADPEEIAKRPLIDDFILTDASGQKKKLSDFQGNVVILSFWASWCAPCLVELPTFAELEKRFYDKGLRVIAVNVDEGEDGKKFAADFWARNKFTFPSFFDNKKDLAMKFDVEALPATFVIDRKRRQVFSGFGANDWTSPEHVERFDTLVNEKEPTPPEPGQGF